MSLVITSGFAGTRGITADETGINVRRFVVRHYPQINEKLGDKGGQFLARAVADKFSRDITFEGEANGTTGVWLFLLGTAFTALTNSIIAYGGGGANPGGVYLDEATVSMERAGWRSLAIRCSSDPQLA